MGRYFRNFDLWCITHFLFKICFLRLYDVSLCTRDIEVDYSCSLQPEKDEEGPSADLAGGAGNSGTLGRAFLGGRDDIMSEMQKKLAQRRAKTENVVMLDYAWMVMYKILLLRPSVFIYKGFFLTRYLKC